MSAAVRTPLWRDPVLVALTVAGVLVLGAPVLDAGTPRAQWVASWVIAPVNGFKNINDTYGHAAGDVVLRHVAGLLRECAGTGDPPARLGGDGFAVPAVGDLAAAERIAARLRDGPAVPARVDGQELRVGASVGLAIGPSSGPGHLLHAADLRMYQDKQRHRSYAS